MDLSPVILLTDQNRIAERWKSYCQKLYEDLEGKLGGIPLPAEEELPILKDEVRAELSKELHNNKAHQVRMVLQRK